MSKLSIKKLDELSSYYEIDSHEDLIAAATRFLYCIQTLELENYDLCFVKLKKDEQGEVIEPIELQVEGNKVNLIAFNVGETLQGYLE